MKTIIRFLTIVSLLSPISLTVNSCSSDNDIHHAKEISAAISNNHYKLDVKVGISKEYLIQQITNDFIKKPLTEAIDRVNLIASFLK